jgi:hypothetical protein
MEGFILAQLKPVGLKKIKKFPYSSMKYKVEIKDFAPKFRKNLLLKDFLTSLPNFLKAVDFKNLVEKILQAVQKKKPVIFALGAHPIKCGLSLLLIDLMEKGVITCLSLNGAGLIHDFEIALRGKTSEDVEAGLKEGSFGLRGKTAHLIHQAIKNADSKAGLGQTVGEFITQQNFPYQEYSLLATAFRLNLPATVHIAIGTDIIHQTSEFDPQQTSQLSFTDFKILCAAITKLGDGGVFLNIGSAVILPEVFLKALNIARNLGHRVENFTTANFDMIAHYRPLQNVVKRPTKGTGYNIIGHHEIMLPLLSYLLLEKVNK